MKIKYFTDTDTLYLSLSDFQPSETREISDDIFVDYDGSGRIVGLTIEHAKLGASSPDFSYQLIGTNSIPEKSSEEMQMPTRKIA